MANDKSLKMAETTSWIAVAIMLVQVPAALGLGERRRGLGGIHGRADASRRDLRPQAIAFSSAPVTDLRLPLLRS